MSTDDLRWDDLRVFLELHRLGTLTAAASRLGVHTSTAQRRLTALESSLGTRLFDRSPSGLTPTAAGEAMVPLATQVEEDVDTLRRSMVGRDQSPRGPVHLTAPEPLLPLLVGPLAEFRRRYPDIDLQVSFSDRFYDLDRREADVALRPSATPPETAVGRRIADVAWAVYAAPASLDINPQDTLPWAIFGDELGRLSVAAWWRDHHGQSPVHLTVNSVSAMRQVVACSPCRGLLPCFVGDPDPGLLRLHGPIDAPESGLWLLVHRDLRRAARVRALLDHLWQTLAGERALFTGAATR